MLAPPPGATRPSHPRAAAVSAPVPAMTPYALTAAHFGAALAFFAAGSLALVWVAPDLAAGRYLQPRVVAVAHLFTLGWITVSIMGALYQLLPVVIGAAVRWPALGLAALLLFAPGLAMFIAGLLAGATGVMIVGAGAFGTGLLLFAVNAGASLLRAPHRDLTWWAVAGALLFLLITVALGVSLAGNLRWFHLGERRLLALGVHMHVALGGWVLLMVIGVGRKLLPMFLLSHGVSHKPAAAAAALVASGAAVLALFHHAPGMLVTWSAALLLGSGTLTFIVQAARYLRSGRRPTLDAGLRLAAAGVVFLTLSVLLGAAAVVNGFASAGGATAYGVSVVLGAFTLFVAGHYYKILPFLAWNRHFAPLVGRGSALPKVTELYDARIAAGAAVLLTAGAAGLVAATLTSRAGFATAAAVSFAAGACALVAQMINIFMARPES